MLTPHKHSRPDDTVLAAATVLLAALRSGRVVSYDSLRSKLAKKSRSSDYLFTPAIDLLYILGLVEYRPTVDSFEYVGA